MQKKFPYLIKFESAGMIFVKVEGVKWLHENYFRRDYLKELEGCYKIKKITGLSKTH